MYLVIFVKALFYYSNAVNFSHLLKGKRNSCDIISYKLRSF